MSATVPPMPPAGIGDLLPPEARAQRALAARVLERFALHGYDLVTPPPFELAEVIERGIDTLDSRDLLRFVEPESGEVAVLRPDITPQIARIVATRLAEHPPPWRLCYEGRVIRRRHGRARRHRQIVQAGVECIGLAGTEVDADLIQLAAEVCEAAGLTRFRIELSQVTLAQSALERMPAEARPAISEALRQKDPAALAERLKEARIGEPHRGRMLALVDHYGDPDVLKSAQRSFRWDEAKVALRNLADLVARLNARGLAPRLGVDLSDVRNSSYYTGASFSLLAEGPGEAIGAGGRYDNLLGRYGNPAPATGFSVDLDNMQWALRRAGNPLAEPHRPRVVAAQGSDDSRMAGWIGDLRDAGIAVATLPQRTLAPCLAFARAWGYHGVLLAGTSDTRVVRISDRSQRKLDASHPNRVVDQLAELGRWVVH